MNSEITLFTTHCPKCRVLESKLAAAGVSFGTVDDASRMLEEGVKSIPTLRVDGRMMGFYDAVRYVNSMEAVKNEH